MQVRDGNKVRIRLCCLMCVPVQQRKHIKINTAIGARYRSISIGDLTRTRRRQRGQRLLGNVFIFYFSISQLSSSIQWACGVTYSLPLPSLFAECFYWCQQTRLSLQGIVGKDSVIASHITLPRLAIPQPSHVPPCSLPGTWHTELTLGRRRGGRGQKDVNQ